MAVIDNLIAYWSLDEASGDAIDAHGSNDLAASASAPGATTGVVSGARDFELSSAQYFSRASNADLQAGDIELTIAGWFQLESTPGADITAISKGSASSFEYYLQWQHANAVFGFGAFGSSSFGNGDLALATTFGSPTTGTWYFVVGWHDPTANTLNISINDGVVDSVGHSTGIYVGTNDFYLSSLPFGGYWDGLMDEVAIWKRVLTSDEITWLYNAGSGRSYADIVAEAGGGDQTLTPSAVTAAWTLAASTIAAISVTLSPAAVAPAWAVPASTISASPVTLSPAATTAAWAVPASTLSAISVTLSPAAVAPAWAVPDSDIAIANILSPASVTASWSLPASDITGSGSTTLSPGVISALWHAPASTTAGSGNASALAPASVTASWAVPASDVHIPPTVVLPVPVRRTLVVSPIVRTWTHPREVRDEPATGRAGRSIRVRPGSSPMARIPIYSLDPQDLLDYQIDWTPFLEDDTIASSSWTADTGLTISSPAYSDTATTMWVSAATATDGQSLVATNQITTVDGRVKAQSIRFKIREA